MQRTKLKLLRVEKGWSQEDVAKQIGISTQSYALIERGIRFGSHGTWEKIKELYKLTDAEMWSIQSPKE